MKASSRKRDESLEPLAAVLRKFRSERRLSQERLAHQARVDRPVIGNIERCERNVSFKMVRRVVRGMGISWREFGALLDEVDPLV